MKVQVNDPRAATNIKAGFWPTEPGEHEFSDDPQYQGWLAGMKARGAIADPTPNVSPTMPEAYGLTAGSTSGAPKAQVDEQEDRKAAQVTQRGEHAGARQKRR